MTAHDRLRTVFENEHARLWRSLFAHTGDADIASDAAAEAFAQAVRRGDAMRDPTAWVWRTAFRIAGGHLASRWRLGDPAATSTATEDTLPEDVVALLDALARLGEVERRVVVLSLVGGLSATDVGRIVGASPGAVRVRLHRARKKLIDVLGADAPSAGGSQREGR